MAEKMMKSSMTMANVGPGFGKKLKQAAFKVKTKIKAAKSQRKMKELMRKESPGTSGSSSQENKRTLNNNANSKSKSDVVSDVEALKRKDTLKRNVKTGIGKIGDFIKNKVSDIQTESSSRRYKKGKGPRGERATESGSATDEQVCGPDGKCKVKTPLGLGIRR